MPTLPDLAAHLARLQTVTAHAGATPDPATGAVTQPLHLSTTFRHPANAAGHTGYLYSRADNPTRRELEAVLAELEQGEAGFAFSSGVAAIHAALAALRPGDHVLAHHQLYMGARALLRDFFLPWGLQVEFTDLRDLAAVATRFTAHTRLIWAETPSNPLLEGLDLAALAELAHTHGALLAVDNTFATPVGQQPLALGADLVMHATTKYLAGHSDVLGGGIVVRTATDYSARIRQVQQLVGGVPSPFDCYLTLRGIRSLVPRYRQQCASAQQIAEVLATHPAVARVNYPGLATHPDYALFQRQQYLPGAILSVHLHGGAEKCFRFIDNCTLWVCATSVGGTESLIEHRASTEGETSPTQPDLVRLSVGLEDPAALVADLCQALERV